MGAHFAEQLSPGVVPLAQVARAERDLPLGHLDPARLAALPDELEAGCTAADILAHLRSHGPHVRGCWALDLMLARGDPMTEADWLAFDDPVEMLKDIGRRLTVRKGRLVACALCRRIWDRLEPTSRDAAEMAERYADRGVTKRAVAAARPAILKPAQDIREYWRRSAALSCFQAFEELADVAAWGAARGVMGAISGNADTRDSWAHERKLQVALVRDILDNPFRPRPQLPAPAPHVRGLAQAAYDERALPSGHLDPARLAVLSDALEEAGCTDADILTHLRSPSPHVRGCWALDLVLARG